MRVDRRGLVGGVAGAALAWAVTLGHGASGAPEPVPATAAPKLLHFANRPDFIAEDTIQKFEAETGIKVTYDTYQADDALFAALKAGNKSGWDLVVASGVPNLVWAIRDQLLTPLVPGKLANAGNLDSEIEAALAAVDPGHKFAVPYLWGTSGLGINTARLKQTVPDAPTDSLALIFDPALAARAAGCGIAMADAPEDAVSAALAFLGLDPNVQDERSMAKVADLLMKLKPTVKRLSLNDFAEQLGNGTICVGFGPSTAVSDARTRADDLEDGPDIAYVIPKEHARRWIDVLVLPVGGANLDSAYAFIDYVLRPEIISDITDLTGAANPNTLAADFVDEDDKSDETVFPSAASRTRLFLDKPSVAEQKKARQRLWARTKP